jgi:hypothetical protein
VHSEELDIIDIAIRVLTNLASELDDEDQQIMAQEGAVQAIVEVATQHTDNLELEISAIGCLCNLARAEFNANMIIKQGGAEAAVSAMSELDYDVELSSKAMNLIATLALVRSEMDRMLDAGVVTGLVNALEAKITEEAVVMSGMIALSNMCFSEAVAARMAEEGPADVIFAVMEAELDNAHVLAACYKALGGLSRCPENAPELAEGAMEHMCPELVKHNNNDSFILTAFGFLGNLCVHAECSNKAKGTDIIKSVLTCLATHVGKAKILIRGCMALSNMAYGSKELRDKMRSDGTVRGMQDIIDANPTLDDVKQAAESCMETLNRKESNLSSLPFTTMRAPVVATKSAKELFGDAPKAVTELSREDRNFLVSGALLMKHSKSAKPKRRHLSISADLKWIICKKPGKAAAEPKQKMKVFKMKQVDSGRCTPQLSRKSFGRYLAKKECSFAIIGRDRTFDIECSSEKERDEWIKALETLMAYNKALKIAGTKFSKR